MDALHADSLAPGRAADREMRRSQPEGSGPRGEGVPPGDGARTPAERSAKPEHGAGNDAGGTDGGGGGGGLSGPSIRHPVGTSLIWIGILLIGIASYPFLPVAPLPQVDSPTIQVSAELPGASPETMASSVAQPLESEFARVEGVTEMTSQNSFGSTQITLRFDLDRDIDGAANDVQAAINAAQGQLPSDLPSPPTYRKVNPADSPTLMLAATSDTLPLTAVDDALETRLAQQLSQISGVGQVVVGGKQKPALRVQIDPARLVAKGMALEDVRAALAGVILLIGIVKKNGIMLVDFAIAAEKEGKSSEEAIRQAARLRFRPIMMTAFAAILGGVPLMLGHGTGAELRQPLGYVMVGGLIVSQALTLFTTPVVYLYLDRLQSRLARLSGKRVEAKSGNPVPAA